MTKFNSVDLFSGIGGLSLGLKDAGFRVVASVELDKDAVEAYKKNHPKAKVFDQDIRTLNTDEIKKLLKGQPLHLLAGCPPCQGFSSMRRLNKRKSVRDSRNSLVMEYLRLVKELRPLTIMMENVPGLKDYYLFKEFIKELHDLGYNPKFEIANVKDYGIPQRRKRLVLVGSLLGDLNIVEGTFPKRTVWDTIGHLESVDDTNDEAHKIYASHTARIQEMIERIPKDGGSRKDVPEYTLECHKKENVGFNDVYGRLRWNDYSTTITGGCLNPSKGRFLHPEENRCITAREAALLQSFPYNYIIPSNLSKTKIALLLGNALPPKFSFVQAENVRRHIQQQLKTN